MRLLGCAAALLAPTLAWAQVSGGDGASPWALLAQALLSLIIVVGIIYLVYFGLRRLDRRRSGVETEGPMRVIQARHLGGDRWLYLVEVEGRRLVVGGADGHIAPIADLGDTGGDSHGEA